MQNQIESANDLLNEAIYEIVKKLTKDDQTLNLPGSNKNFSAIDYENFFEYFNHRLETLEHRINNLNLTPCSSVTLKGLIAYFSKNENLQVNNVTLDISLIKNLTEEELNNFLTDLKATLRYLDKAGIKSIKLIDNNAPNNPAISQAIWSGFINEIIALDVTVKISLPTHKELAREQRILNEIRLTNIKEKNIRKLQESNANKQSDIVISNPEQKKSRRKFKRNHNVSIRDDVMIDIEMQQEHAKEAQVQVESTLEIQTNVESSIGSHQELNGLDLKGLSTALESLSLNSDAELITQYELIKYFHLWLGHICIAESIETKYIKGQVQQESHYYDICDDTENTYEITTEIDDLLHNQDEGALIHKITIEAAQYLINNRDYFNFGLEIKYLPIGFVLQKDPNKPDKFILHYDKNSNKEQDLAPIVREKIIPSEFSDELLQEILQDNSLYEIIITKFKQNKPEYYDPELVSFIQTNIEFLLTLDEAKLDKLIELCSTNEQLKLDNLSYFVTNHQKIAKAFLFRFEPNKFSTQNITQRLNLRYGSNIEGVIDLARDIYIQNDKHKTHHRESIYQRYFTPLNIQASNQVPSTYQNVDNRYKLYFIFEKFPEHKDRLYKSLFNVFIKYGDEGIEALIDRLEKLFDINDLENNSNFFTEILLHVFASDENNFLHLIEDKNFYDALDTVKAMRKTEQSREEYKYTWFKKLLNKHLQSGSKGYLPDLVNAFQYFSEKVHNNYNLSFYKDINFANIRNLPTTLSRILAILESSHDRREQWQCISELNLQPTGARRAFQQRVSDNFEVYYTIDDETYSQKHQIDKCSFVTPEMDVNPIDYDPNFGYLKYINRNPTNYKQLQKREFSLLAHCKYKLSLDFYLKCNEYILKEDGILDEQIDLWRILRLSTTNRFNISMIESNDKAKKDWEEIFKSLRELPTFPKNFRAQFITKLTTLNFIPLPILKNLINLILSVKNNLATLRENFNLLLKAMHDSSGLLAYYDSAIYEGMKYYTEDKYLSTPSIFYTHLEFLNALVMTSTHVGAPPVHCVMSDTKETIKAFISLISAFDLVKNDSLANKGQAEELKDKIAKYKGIKIYLQYPLKTAFDGFKALEVAFKILKDIDIDKLDNLGRPLPKLNVEHLNHFLEQLDAKVTFDDHGGRVITYDVLINLIKENFSEYFPVDYFEKIQADIIPDEIVEILEKYNYNAEEKAQVIKILEKCNVKGAQSILIAITHNLIKITENLSSNNKIKALTKIYEALEKEIQITKYTQVDALLAQIRIDNSSSNAEPNKNNTGFNINDFNELLNLISEKNLINDFMFFLEKLDKIQSTGNWPKSLNIQAKPIKGSLIYLNLLPVITNIASNNINSPEMINLSLQVLSASQSKEENYSRNDEIYFKELQLLLNNTPLEPLKLERTLKQFFSTINNNSLVNITIPELGELYKHLKYINEASSNELTKQHANANSPMDTYWYTEAVNFVFSLFNPSNNKTTDTSSAIQKAVVTKLPVTIDPLLIENAQKTIQELSDRRQTFTGKYADLLKSISKFVDKFPSEQKLILKYINYYLVNQESGKFLYCNIIKLITEFSFLGDNEILRSLFNNFDGEHDKEFTHTSLIELINNETYLAFLKKEDRIFFLNLLNALINDNKSCSIIELKKFMKKCQESSSYFNLMKKIYTAPPYPTFKEITDWENKIKQTQHISENSENFLPLLEAKALQFNKAPCDREESDNGFKIERATEQILELKGFNFDNKKLEQINTEVQTVRNYETAKILKELQSNRSNPELLSNEKLLALVAELLYRTKGSTKLDAAGKQILGSSFVINTTQYLAIYAMLESGNQVTSEIATGEGKSRIMMLLAACQYAKGKTVDFVTSDLQLATRDYLSFSSFFKALGAKTSLIYQFSPTDSYVKDGINFSDAANLSLFRNKARSQINNNKVIEQNAKKRCLLIDEADKAYFDMSSKRFNYSAMADASLQDIPWIYEYLMEFFADEKNIKLYHDDPDECDDAFGAFVLQADTQRSKFFNAFSLEQRTTWLKFACKASTLNLDVDFKIIPNVETQTSQGLKICSEAQILIDNRLEPGSKFSLGLHQCLHARLNRLKKIAQSKEGVNVTDKLTEALKDLKHDFYIDNEKQIIYSSTSKSLIDEYRHGSILAVSGTTGGIREREEVKILYGNESSQMKFIDIPRHKPLQRKDYPLYLTADSTKQLKSIIKQIKEAQILKKPVLIIAENDEESNEIMQHLQMHLFLPDVTFKRISSETNAQEIAEHVEKHAGRTGMITVSTPIIGRGTDIPLHQEAGIRVLATYLPRERDLKQIFGRAGRMGAEGDARLILNKVNLKKKFGKTSLKDGFYTSVETYIKRQHAIMDREAEVERLLRYTIGDFRDKLTNNFFDSYAVNVNEYQRDKLYKPWKQFFEVTDKKWVETWGLIQRDLDVKEPKIATINTELSKYQKFVQESWEQLIANLQSQNLFNNELTLEVGELKLQEKHEKFLTSFNIDSLIPLKTPTATAWDPAFDGKAVLYARPLEKIRASLFGQRPWFADIRAWWNGRGILFPNIRAWGKGHLTTFELLFGSSLSTNNTNIPETKAALAPTENSAQQLGKLSEIITENPIVTNDIQGDFTNESQTASMSLAAADHIVGRRESPDAVLSTVSEETFAQKQKDGWGEEKVNDPVSPR